MKSAARAGNRSSYHRGNVREDLIELATDILDSEGIDAITLRRLTREIGVNPTNFYNHFANMDYLYAAIKVLGFNDLLRKTAKAKKKQSNQTEQLRALFREYVVFAVKRPNLYRLMFDYYLDFDEHEELKAVTDQAMTEVIELLYDSERFDSTDALGFYKSHPEAVACWATMHGLTHILIERQIKLETKSRKEVTRFADQIVDVLLAGVLGRLKP